MTHPHPRSTPGDPTNSGLPGQPPTLGRGPNALVWRWWNLLLLLPLLMLITPWFNKDSPRLWGLPFFYWYQLLFVFVGVACVSIVYAATRTPRSAALPLETPVDPGEFPPGGPADRGAAS